MQYSYARRPKAGADKKATMKEGPAPARNPHPRSTQDAHYTATKPAALQMQRGSIQFGGSHGKDLYVDVTITYGPADNRQTIQESGIWVATVKGHSGHTNYAVQYKTKILKEVNIPHDQRAGAVIVVTNSYTSKS